MMCQQLNKLFSIISLLIRLELKQNLVKHTKLYMHKQHHQQKTYYTKINLILFISLETSGIEKNCLSSKQLMLLITST